MLSLNEIRDSVFELSRTQVKMYGGGAMDVKPIYPRLLSGDINICNIFDIWLKKYILNFKCFLVSLKPLQLTLVITLKIMLSCLVSDSLIFKKIIKKIFGFQITLHMSKIKLEF